MADILIHSASVADGRAVELDVEIHGLGKRTIDRATAIAWMKDGHSDPCPRELARTCLAPRWTKNPLRAAGAEGEWDAPPRSTLVSAGVWSDPRC